MKAIKKCLAIAIGCIFFLNLIYIINIKSNGKWISPTMNFSNTNVLVYMMPTNSNAFHDEKKTMEEVIIGDRNIYFLETSHIKKKDEISLNSRQGCAVESAARMNPTMKVYLYIFNSPLWNYSNDTRTIIAQLTSYKNIFIRHISLETYFKNSPMEDWWNTTNGLNTSRWFTSHISDVLRYLTLWKFGGIYLDLDVVIKSSLENLKNFVGAEDSLDVAAGVLGFDVTDIGRRYANACLFEIMMNFRGDDWGYNGPGVITRILKKLCGTEIVRNISFQHTHMTSSTINDTERTLCESLISEMTDNRCDGFKVFPPSAFYPIVWRKWKLYFETKNRNNTMKMIENALAIHAWNKHSHSMVIEVGSKVPYELIASQYCPKVYKNSGKTF